MIHPNKEPTTIKEYFNFLCRLIKAFPPFFKEVYSNSPSLRYAYRYFLSIPLFALVYWLFPSLLNKPGDYLDSLYFSVVTITTLGFGDVTPATSTGKLIVITQVVLGVTFWGLFLNALSREHSDFMNDLEKIHQKSNYKRKEKGRLRGHWNLMEPHINKYLVALNLLIGTAKENKLNTDFTLKDLNRFDDLVALTTHNINVTKIEYYYEQLNNISSQITTLIQEVDLQLFPQLEQYCINFVKATYEFDHSGFLIQIVKSEKSSIEPLRGLIATYDGAMEYQENSILNPFISLYKQLKIQISLIDKIGNNIESLNS
jgi:hypothetical protein